MTETPDTKTPVFAMTRAELEQLGRGHLAYVRPINSRQARDMAGGNIDLPDDDTELFCLHMADGTPVSISSTREAAIANAKVNDLTPVALH